MLGLASMLYRCGMVDEAMLVTVMALDNSPDVVAIHFMLANLYAAKVCLEILLLASGVVKKSIISVCYSFIFGIHLMA